VCLLFLQLFNQHFTEDVCKGILIQLELAVPIVIVGVLSAGCGPVLCKVGPLSFGMVSTEQCSAGPEQIDKGVAHTCCHMGLCMFFYKQ
jgi:hypothetical protein